MLPKKFSFRKKDSQRESSQRHASISPSPSNVPSQEQSVYDGASITPSHTTNQPNVLAARRDDHGPGPMGLNVVYSPGADRKADIIFIHGLGGSSRWTWSKYRNPDLFWPLTFLPLESDICRARILSFGYNANFLKSGNASTIVLDFAKELLFDLRFAKDEKNEDLEMGSAYMQGRNDPGYKKIVKAISAILFLATPHRGTNLADILNRLLQSTRISTPKGYISELSKDSFTLQKLNEQFRHVAPKLDIVSFYETQPTSIGLKGARVMILEKESSVLGYPGETSKALDADHHDVCKYESPLDPNYITVRNVLKSILGRIILANQTNQSLASDRRESLDLKMTLAIPELPDVDYIFFKDQWTPGTNAWFLDEIAYQQWASPNGSLPYLLWVSGGAGTGKSVLSSFVINRLVEQGRNCQYFFIRYGERKKRTLSLLLRSIAYQVAQSVPDFRAKLSEFAGEAVDLETADPKTIWERLFKSILFKMERNQPLYWVIDGLDESLDARANIKLLADIAGSSVPIRVLLLGRATAEISAALKKASQLVPHGEISIEGHREDIYAHIHQELSMSGSTDFREDIVKRLVEGAQNNFLWLRLAVEKLNSCYTMTEVERAFQELPPGMEALYHRMATSIAQNPSPSRRNLALAILQCVTCSSRVLTMAELSQALNEDVSDMLDFQQSIGELCGGFVIVDNSGKVSMLHHSAREYLLNVGNGPFSINRDAAHEQLLLSCMRCLMSPGLRGKISREDMPEFLDYSATWWSSHLALTPASRESVYNVIKKFLTGHWVLIWIHALVIAKQLRVLIRASRNLYKYATSRQNIHVAASNEVSRKMEYQFLESWTVDFVKVAGKFATNLRRNPAAIYKLIPPFCPRNSAIYQQFGKPEDKSLAVVGLSAQEWDDSLARLSFGAGTNASSIAAAGTQIAVLAPAGTIFVYNSSDFEEAVGSPITHGERVYRMCLNGTGTLLVTYGFKSIKIWELPTGVCKLSCANLESRPRPLAMLFTREDSMLLVGSDDRRIRSLNLNDPSPTWEIMAELEELQLEGHYLNASSYMSINNEGSLIAVAYRGHPLSAWEIDGPIHINHCWRAREQVARGEVMEAVWHPHSPELLGLYLEGVVFKWNPYEGNPEEIGTGATALAMSRDGSLFATGDVQGTVKVYTMSDFCLLYELASQDAVIDLAFSPSLHRFYDVRGDYATAWEPNVLMRYAERLEKGSDGDSESDSSGQGSTVSMGSSRRIDTITALAASPIGRLYSHGTEYGGVQLFDISRGKLCDIQGSERFLSIEQMSWSTDGRYLCFSDSSQTVFIVSILFETRLSHSSRVEKVMEKPMEDDTEGPITQLLFRPNQNSSHVLVSTPFTVCIIAIESTLVTHSLDRLFSPCKWIADLRDPTHILAVEPNSVTVYDWTLTRKATYRFDFRGESSLTLEHNQDTEGTGEIDRVLITQDKRHILVQMSLGKGLKQKSFFYFALPPFTTSTSSAHDDDDHPAPVTAVILLEAITSQIALALSFLSQDRLVFLSKTFGISCLKVPFDGGDSGRVTVPSPSPYTPRRQSTNAIHHSSRRDSIFGTLQHRRGNSEDGFGSQPQQAKTEMTGAKEIFALPGDWISRDCLALCSIWAKERALLCPRNGEVAVVKSAGLI
ncbi:NACHT and WD domain protein [Aspergillus mulundensis]|uniref:NACHT domain-containing protein n=1 Tax=Aspergillus mulundensis TaxID=1810919 RepID=A0A3D8SLL7_9EURO|nr:Uncharacterized protein DSM5745_03340 [Aspergillus mulundensis]RDW86698.1 Uncharacterized protein DSM5745_03340 [Aspergillus mulundensis]